MKQLKRVFAVVFMLCMVFSLTACGGGSGNGDTEKNSQNTGSQNSEANKDSENSESQKNEIPEGKAVYSVKVVDEAGNPVKSAMVQMCLTTCVFGQTNDEGIATFTLDDAEGYKAEVLSLPEGYAEVSEDPVYLESGSKEVTLTVKTVQ